MREVIYRRYSRLKEENGKMPDLIILDGGMNQLKVGKEVLNELNLNINIVGLVKSNKHKTNGLIDLSGKEYYFDDDKDIFYLLTRMQDEVHRYAISSHINKRNKSMFTSVFDKVNGIGPKKKELLIKTFPTFKDLFDAKIEEMKQILPEKIANDLYNIIHGDETK